MIIDKEPYLDALSGCTVFASGQAYADASQQILVEAVRHEARNPNQHTIGGMCVYSPTIYQRRSTDNGRTWSTIGEIYTEDVDNIEGEHQYAPHYVRDPHTGLLLAFFVRYDYRRELLHAETFSDAGCYTHTFRPFYQISRDQGLTWEPQQQIIATGDEFDTTHWGPGLTYLKNGGMAESPPVLFLRDGTLLHPLVVNLHDGRKWQVAMLRGTWREDLSGLDWAFGEYLSLPATLSSQGCCEPTACLWGDDQLFMCLRACGDRDGKRFPSRKYWVHSDDGGRTFTAPRILTYDDGEPAWSPSSLATVLSHSSGRTFWIGNLLDDPTYDSAPRYPLAIAELDPASGCLQRDTVQLIDTRPDDCQCDSIRFSNFGCYEEHPSTDLILTLPIQFPVSRRDFTAPCYRYRIRLP